jgi:hypothetical protein
MRSRCCLGCEHMKRTHNSIPPRLECNLKDLSLCCTARLRGNRFNALMYSRGLFGSHETGYWPSHELLREIQDDVCKLAASGRVRPIYSVWQAFEQLDRKMPKLRLKLRVDKLVSRARAMLPPTESELEKDVRLAKAGNTQAQCSLGDMAMTPEKLAKALRADQQIERELCMALPLAEWIVSIGHPFAKDFVDIAGFYPPDWKSHRRRILQSARVRRHRLVKKTSSKSVTQPCPLHEESAASAC